MKKMYWIILGVIILIGMGIYYYSSNQLETSLLRQKKDIVGCKTLTFDPVSATVEMSGSQVIRVFCGTTELTSGINWTAEGTPNGIFVENLFKAGGTWGPPVAWTASYNDKRGAIQIMVVP